jgi:hypothetical protein
MLSIIKLNYVYLPPNKKIIYILGPKSSTLERIYGVQITKLQANKNFTFQHLLGNCQFFHPLCPVELKGAKFEDFFVHCNENPIYVFLSWELRGLSSVPIPTFMCL